MQEDLREFIKVLEKTGDLVRIKEEVDWDLEAGAISRWLSERSGPAVLFEKIRDYSEGYRILGGPLATWRRVAVAMGQSPETSVKEIHHIYEERIKHPVKPVYSDSGPCKQNTLPSPKCSSYQKRPWPRDGKSSRSNGSLKMALMRPSRSAS